MGVVNFRLALLLKVQLAVTFLDDRVIEGVWNVFLNVGLCLGGGLLAKLVSPLFISLGTPV